MLTTNIAILVNMHDRQFTRTGGVQLSAANLLKMVIEQGAQHLDTGWSVGLDQQNGVITIRNPEPKEAPHA